MDHSALFNVAAGASVSGSFYFLISFLDRRARRQQADAEEPREAGVFWRENFEALRGEYERHVAHTEEQYRAHEGRIAQLEQHIEQMTQTHSNERLDWARAIGERDSRIVMQQREIEKQQQEITRQQQEITTLKEEVTRLRGRVTQLEVNPKT